jgi:hypothetical protein
MGSYDPIIGSIFIQISVKPKYLSPKTIDRGQLQNNVFNMADEMATFRAVYWKQRYTKAKAAAKEKIEEVKEKFRPKHSYHYGHGR